MVAIALVTHAAHARVKAHHSPVTHGENNGGGMRFAYSEVAGQCWISRWHNNHTVVYGDHESISLRK